MNREDNESGMGEASRLTTEEWSHGAQSSSTSSSDNDETDTPPTVEVTPPEGAAAAAPNHEAEASSTAYGAQGPNKPQFSDPNTRRETLHEQSEDSLSPCSLRDYNVTGSRSRSRSPEDASSSESSDSSQDGSAVQQQITGTHPHARCNICNTTLNGQQQAQCFYCNGISHRACLNSAMRMRVVYHPAPLPGQAISRLTCPTCAINRSRICHGCNALLSSTSDHQFSCTTCPRWFHYQCMSALKQGAVWETRPWVCDICDRHRRQLIVLGLYIIPAIAALLARIVHFLAPRNPPHRRD